METMNYSLVFYVPQSYLEQVKQALFAAGAGQLGDYEHCCWQVLGQGQFRPTAAANPFIGQPGSLEQLAEWRVEMLVPASCIKAVLQALRQSHPYEEPAFVVTRHEF